MGDSNGPWLTWTGAWPIVILETIAKQHAAAPDLTSARDSREGGLEPSAGRP